MSSSRSSIAHAGAHGLPWLMGILALGALAGFPRPAGARPGELANGLSGLYERVSPAVVRVVSHRVTVLSSGSETMRTTSATSRRFVASGVVVTEHGCVVTTDHAVQPGDSVVVQFPDGLEVGAQYVGRNDAIHVAVLHLVGPRSFPWLAPATTPVRQLPEWIAAVAYGPWGDTDGHEPALTLAQGSAICREKIRCADSTATVWRLKAPLYPGNAGGALLTLDGEWLGLITGVVAGDAPGPGGQREEGVIMPADLVMRAVTEIESGRPPELARGFLGVRTFRRVVSASDSLWHGIGVIVSEVLDGGPAQRYGIRPGDVILRFGDTPVEDANQLTRLVGQARPGAAVQLEILRAGSPQRVQVNLGDAMIGQAALAHRRELDFERSQLRREVLQLEERLNLLRRRLETLEPGEERDRVRGPGDSSRD